MSLTVVDVGRSLLEAEREPPSETTQRLHDSAHVRWDLIVLQPGERWEPPLADLEERHVLVLHGHGTFRVDAERETLGGGQLLVLDPGAALVVEDDDREPLQLLVGLTPLPRDASPDEGSS